MSFAWMVNVGGQVYGPYTVDQMKSFVAEGRVIPQSLVAQPGESEFHPASNDPDLTHLFRNGGASPEPVHSFTQNPADDIQPLRFGETRQPSGEKERSHFVIIADMKSGSIHGLEEEIFNLGPAYPILPQVWILSSDVTAISVKNLLAPKLGKLDSLFVVDATHDKIAWNNFAPEAESRLRRLWLRADATPKSAA